METNDSELLSMFPEAIRSLPHLQIDPGSVVLYVLLITPERAKKLLERNINVRPMMEREVARYCAILTAGAWGLNGETIKLDRDGNLVDGQHRLEACIRTGIPFWSAVARCVPPDGVDEGARRTAGQLLSGRGIAWGNLAAAFARNMLYLSKGKDPWMSTEHVPNQELILFFEHRLNDELRNWAIGMSGARSRLLPGSVVCTAAYVMAAHTSKNQAEDYLGSLFSGANLDEESPRLHLRRWLESETAATALSGRLSNRAKFIAVFRAFQMETSGKRMRRGVGIWGKIHSAPLPDAVSAVMCK